jgi:hypothetical protein
MKTIVAFLLGMATGVVGLVMLQHPNALPVLAQMFRSSQQPPQIRLPLTDCDPAWFCREANEHRQN